ncbi:MAG: hypothetical protein OER43_00050 [Gammaproteobacteria bacterium]|nr:hypothetical protein [Gammaproteobacteria bacterium]MDH3412106.1 hypothetical protein [Gammaproteobacteria bacterium]
MKWIGTARLEEGADVDNAAVSCSHPTTLLPPSKDDVRLATGKVGHEFNNVASCGPVRGTR